MATITPGAPTFNGEFLQGYTPILVGDDLVWIVSTATCAVQQPPPPPGVVNVFYNTQNHLDYENPNAVVVTNDVTTGGMVGGG